MMCVDDDTHSDACCQPEVVLQAKTCDSEFVVEAIFALRAAIDDAELAEQAEDLLSQMLHIDPAQRCTVEEALSHSLLVHFTTCRYLS